MTRWIVCLDLDNAYASMEQLLTPRYRNRALVVTGSNGGNVIARSKHAKQLGVAMGAPRHEIEPYVRNGQLIVVSANFATYHDLSQRFLHLVQSFVDGGETEPYSVVMGSTEIRRS